MKLTLMHIMHKTVITGIADQLPQLRLITGLTKIWCCSNSRSSEAPHPSASSPSLCHSFSAAGSPRSSWGHRPAYRSPSPTSSCSAAQRTSAFSGSESLACSSVNFVGPVSDNEGTQPLLSWPPASAPSVSAAFHTRAIVIASPPVNRKNKVEKIFLIAMSYLHL